MSARTLAVERLAELVSIETPTGDAVGLEAAQQLVRSWLEPIIGEPGIIETVDGIAHLRWAGGDAPAVLLIGHLDTVFPKGTILDRPFRIDGDRATGPGVFDMKAGIVIMAAALARIARPGEVAVLLTSDEEVGSLTSRALIEREARRAGTVLVLEPSLDGALKIARRGGSIYRIGFTGRAAHAGLEPWKGRSALAELAHHVLALPELADDAAGDDRESDRRAGGHGDQRDPRACGGARRRARLDARRARTRRREDAEAGGSHRGSRRRRHRRHQPPADGGELLRRAARLRPAGGRAPPASGDRGGLHAAEHPTATSRPLSAPAHSTASGRVARARTPTTSGCRSTR